MSANATESRQDGTTRRRRSRTKTATASTSPQGQAQGALVCPECGKTFSRPQALGAHRSRTHGVAGSSRAARVKAASRRVATSASVGAGRSSRRSAKTRLSAQQVNDGFDPDNVLAALFPNGIPAKASVVAALAPWLDEAERLSRMR
jgi:C2H2-type zinc finger